MTRALLEPITSASFLSSLSIIHGHAERVEFAREVQYLSSVTKQRDYKMQIVDARCVWDFRLILYFLECGVVSLNIKQDESGFSLQRIERRCGSDIITRSGLQVSSCVVF